jgi:hypothetical protein
MSLKRKSDELVRQIRRTIKWCGQRRAPRGGANRLREAELLFREALDGVDDAEALNKLLAAVGYLAEYLDQLR